MAHSIENGPDDISVKRVWYRSSLFNACVIGAVGFLAPGLWNAMNSLGAGGEEKPFLVNAANSLVFGLMGIFCLFGAPIANRIGLKWTLLLGAIGYPIYSAGLYTNNRFGTVWLVLFGSATCGISAGLFWASEGAIAIGYPEPAKRARYLNIWVWWRTLGPLVGDSIVLALNINSSGIGSISHTTYLVFIVLQCLAAPVAFLLTSPAKVQRGDGSRVIIVVEKSWKDEFKALWRTCKNPTVVLLLPIFWAVYFNQYTGNFKAYYFGVRARALMAFVTDVVTIIGSQTMSHWLDSKITNAKKRVVYGWYWVVFVHVVTWIYAWVIQGEFISHPPKLDYKSPGFVKGAFAVWLWAFAQQTAQNWLYYIVGSMTDNIAELTRLTGILRGQESFGQAVSYGLNSKKWYGGRVPMAVNTILLGLCVVPTWIVVHRHDPEDFTKKYTQRQDSEGDTASGEEVIVSSELKAHSAELRKSA
ncbi:conserved hypothetical protein [Talaromyces stipitatus ATCC 10500]|uniref:DUF895 domain membrane protein n=1 Tax=Talaromyces stipitatus (strain ATCC 10500 / CBS 375.48 / QM 6759 / NRRL 1006) TaxID=441959 RepID=B8MHF7_TALSN|nr:uncharacterized protein TSTA_021930 [Talaromyces stipitatus ATCC 10500]EED17136.1 conserved hypothetical protein [Talaromyces stipitatus ATCC 10500]